LLADFTPHPTMEFPDTQWTVLAQATLRGGEAERAALDRLCRDYWRPVWACLKGRGVADDRLDDLTQEFFLHLMERGFFRKADAAQGRFRHFLLGSLRYFLAEDARKNRTQKAGGGWERCELTNEALLTEMDAAQFDREWARALLDRTLAGEEEHICSSRGRSAWEALRRFLPGAAEEMSHAELARVLRMSEGGAKSEVSRMRQRYRDAIRREISRTVAAPHEIDEEMAHLREILRAGIGGD